MTTATDFLGLVLSPMLRPALFTCLGAGLLCGVVGPFILWRRLSLMGDAMAHASLSTSAIALLLKIPLSWVGIPSVLFFSQVLALVDTEGRSEVEAVVAMLYSGLLALGILILAISGQGSQEMVHLLLGDILVVNWNDFALLVAAAILVVGYLWTFRQELVLISLHKDIAEIEGIHVKLHHFLLLAMIGLVIGVGLRLMGVVLMTGLFVVPPLIAKELSGTMRGQFKFSILFGLIISALGFILSILLDLPTGPTIAAFGLICYLLVRVVKKGVEEVYVKNLG
jgi:zinc transport system permease protein